MPLQKYIQNIEYNFEFVDILEETNLCNFYKQILSKKQTTSRIILGKFLILTFKALLLAAGLGTRLRPLTNNIPKCLVEIGKKPILEIWLENLSKAGCEAVLINTHYFSDKVEEYLHNKKFGKMKIITSYEPELLGTVGTLIENADFLDKNCMFIHADNFTDTNLREFLKFHVNYSIPKNDYLP